MYLFNAIKRADNNKNTSFLCHGVYCGYTSLMIQAPGVRQGQVYQLPI